VYSVFSKIESQIDFTLNEGFNCVNNKALEVPVKLLLDAKEIVGISGLVEFPEPVYE
jgi:hypothetical protein